METYFIIMISLFLLLFMVGLGVLAWGTDKSIVESFKGTCPTCGRNIYGNAKSCQKCGHPHHVKCYNPEQCAACTRKPPGK